MRLIGSILAERKHMKHQQTLAILAIACKKGKAMPIQAQEIPTDDMQLEAAGKMQWLFKHLLECTTPRVLICLACGPFSDHHAVTMLHAKKHMKSSSMRAIAKPLGTLFHPFHEHSIRNHT